MADSRRIDVTDTNIWIDLYPGGIIHEAFQLPLRFMAPDVVIAELWVTGTCGKPRNKRKYQCTGRFGYWTNWFDSGSLRPNKRLER